MELVTPRLRLRELAVTDAAAAQAWESDPQVVRYQSTDVLGLDESRAYLQRIVDDALAAPRQVWELGVERQADRLLLGRVGLRASRGEHREGEIWFVLRRDCQGQGYGLEAMRALCDFAFTELALHRIWGDCDPRNQPSARLMERLGMRREGHLRENWWLKGEWCDSYLYAILDREFTQR